MPNKMLIDASHPEETRVVVLRGNRVEEFDFESASKKQLRGNIYLAKVTRVEPSLQAAFVEYGGNRHGFLAFSEIHPDYYQIPVADRQALLEEENRAHDEEDEEEEVERRPRRGRRRRRDRAPSERRHQTGDESVSETAPANDADLDGTEPADSLTAEELSAEAGEPATAAAVEQVPAEPVVTDDVAPAVIVTAEAEIVESRQAEAEDEASSEEPHEESESVQARAPDEETEGEDDDEEEEEEEHIEQVGGDALEEAPRRKARPRRQYKIQEVIKRRQVLLVQVVKEERGNKGAALTTYLSLAGRYSVLMPNTARGGGISRKITDSGDRKRLKSIVQDLDVPEGMGVILRTAGASRTRPEVRRDFEYLLRMWETVRELTLKSSAPALVYEEGSLIKRAIRDLYNKDIDEVLVAGDAGYREAKDFMRLIMPAQARNVLPWRDPQPIFVRSGVETQLDAMFSNHVTLRSGGYLVINQTEALVAIDVNSGRSTREHNIEDTALRTNLEAADEVARQLRLRDLAGLIVVDFIDMEESRNNRSVERRLKEALKNDRARIQVGRISHFGLLEMSRQRIRTGVLEGSTIPCPHCAGAGTVRSVSSIALHVLRVLEDSLTKGASHDLIVRTRTAVALYVLNHKRGHLRDIERKFGVHISVEADERMVGTAYHAIERGEPATGTPEPVVLPPYEEEEADVVEDFVEVEEELEAEETSEASGATEESEASTDDREGDSEEPGRRKRRRRRRRGNGDRDTGDRQNGTPIAADAPQPSDEGLASVAEANEPAFRASSNGSREGYWTREKSGEPTPFHAVEEPATPESSVADLDPAPETAKEVPITPPPVATAPVDAVEPPVAREPAPPREPTEIVITSADPSKPKRGGWWSRAKATLGGN